MNVLFIFQPKEDLLAYFREGLQEYPGINLIIPENTEQETLIELAAEADVFIGWRPTKELLEVAPHLKVLINPGAGVQHHFEELVDIYRSRNIKLLNCHGNAYFTAQHVVAMLLALTNQLIPHHSWMKEGKWRLGDKEAISIPFRNRHIGLLGFGNINQYVYQMLKGFDVSFSILKNRPFAQGEAPIEKVSAVYVTNQIHNFLKAIDILILAVPMTSQTKGLIGQKELDMLGKKGIVVNVARGAVIDEESLYNSLKTKKISGAALDVWYNYKVEEDEQGRKFPYTYPFYELDNVVLSPHRAASPYNDLERWSSVVQNLKDIFNGRERLENEVNLKLEY